MRKILLCAVMALFCSSPIRAGTYHIIRDHGGNLMSYQLEYSLYEKIAIEGECDSACTLALGHKDNVCVTPNARLGFHSAYWPTKKGGRGKTSFIGTTALWNAYPAAVQKELGGLFPKIRYLSGRQLIALGVRQCQA